MNIGWVEVDHDIFKGSLLLPLGRHKQGFPYAFVGDGNLPAGERVNVSAKEWGGEVKGCQIKADGVARYFLRSHIEVLTHQQALDRMAANIAKAARETTDAFNAREAAAAQERGMTVQQYRSWRNSKLSKLRRGDGAWIGR